MDEEERDTERDRLRWRQGGIAEEERDKERED